MESQGLSSGDQEKAVATRRSKQQFACLYFQLTRGKRGFYRVKVKNCLDRAAEDRPQLVQTTARSHSRCVRRAQVYGFLISWSMDCGVPMAYSGTEAIPA